MYIDWYPCADCARAIIQSGISTLICVEPDWEHEKWGADFRMVEEMLEEVGMLVRFHEEEK
jgi:dCMP deaminase